MSKRTTKIVPTESETLRDYIIRINPLHYLHVKDTNTNIVQVVTGPRTYTCLDHEKVVFGPVKMIIIPPRNYVIVENPVIRKMITGESGKETHEVVTDEYGQAFLRHGDKEIRFEQPPFPLYHGEKCGQVKPLLVIEENTALRLRALRDFEDRYAKGIHRRAGEEWIFCGRATYYPQVEVDVVTTIKARNLKSTEALKLRARDDCVDYKDNKRKAGEEWLVKREGPYLPNVHEEVVEIVKAHILTHRTAIHLRAKTTFVDEKGIERKAGTEWIITREDSVQYIPNVHEEVTKKVDKIILGISDYCIIKDPVENGKPKLGTRKLIRGLKSFFLKPGESMEGSIQQSIILAPNEAVWITAIEDFVDSKGIRRRPGDVWLHCGPGEYWNPFEAKVQKRVKAIVALEPIGLYIFNPLYALGGVVFIFLLLIYYLFF